MEQQHWFFYYIVIKTSIILCLPSKLNGLMTCAALNPSSVLRENMFYHKEKIILSLHLLIDYITLTWCRFVFLRYQWTIIVFPPKSPVKPTCRGCHLKISWEKQEQFRGSVDNVRALSMHYHVTDGISIIVKQNI